MSYLNYMRLVQNQLVENFWLINFGLVLYNLSSLCMEQGFQRFYRIVLEYFMKGIFIVGIYKVMFCLFFELSFSFGEIVFFYKFLVVGFIG